jgi:hypothetical protein
MHTVPLICDSLATTPVRLCLQKYPHLNNFSLTEMAQHSVAGPPEVSIVSDHYWKIVTGNMHNKLGWVLTEPISCVSGLQLSATMITFSLQTSAAADSRNLENS